MSHAPLLCAALVRSFGSRTAILRKQLTQLGVLLAAFLCIHLQGAARAQSGSLDLTFGTHTSGFFGANGPIYSVVPQADGKVLVGGDLPGRIARYNPDGSLDSGFNPGAGADGSVHAVSLQPDGKIVIGGAFTTYGGVARGGIARLNADGSLDTTFDPGAGANGTVHGLVLLSSGQLVIGGTFTSYAGVARSRIARLDATGALDATFANGANATRMLVA